MGEWLLRGIAGGVTRAVEGGITAAPTLLVGLLIAAVFRFYFGGAGIRQVFGGDSARSIPQSWLVGMLLPVCSIGVLPILVEMVRARVKPGALSAFALSAPLFNPLSLLYGMTLSRPLVILMFAFGSLVVVTAVGWLWDRRRSGSSDETEKAAEGAPNDDVTVIGIDRLRAIAVYVVRQLAGPVGGWAIVGVSGLVLLGMALPFASMQTAVERDDWTAPATMTAVALPAYATPMLAMSQLGMMFQHANSPGAAFVLLVLGTGVNVATVIWMGRRFGRRPVTIWLLSTVAIVLGIGYAINRPLMPHGVEPAGHTHAFDIYTNPIQDLSSFSASATAAKVVDGVEFGELVAVGLLSIFLVAGLVCRVKGVEESIEAESVAAEFGDGEFGVGEFGVGDSNKAGGFHDPIVSPRLVGATLLVGLIGVSVVMCYAYYPSAEETLEEVRIVRVETLSGARSGRVEHALFWLNRWEDWSRKLEVGTFLRRGEVRPYQRMQGYLIRKKLEALEHELEHDPYEPDEVLRVVESLEATHRRWVRSFQSDGVE